MDVTFRIAENTGQPHRPALLVLPGLSEDVEGYDNRVIPIRIA